MSSLLPDYPPAFWIAAIAAVIIVGIAKAGFGSGPGLVATPLIALTIPVADAVALLLPLLIVIDLISVRHYRHSFDSASLRVLLPAAVAGIAVGAFFFGYFSANERMLQIGMGLLALIFVLFQTGRGLLAESRQGWRPSRRVGYALGATGGFTSTLAHAGGPPVVIYLLPQKLPRQIFVGTTVVAFMVINLIKLIPYSLLGLLRMGNLFTILLLSPFAFIGVQLGVWLNRHFNERWFNIIIYILLLLTGLQLILGRSLLGLILAG